MQVEHSPHVYKTFLCSCFHQDAFNHQLQFILTTLEMFKNVTNDLQSIGTQIMKVCHTNVSSKIWQLIKSMHPAIHTSSGYVIVNNYFTYFYGCSCFWPHLVEMMWVNLVFINTTSPKSWTFKSTWYTHSSTERGCSYVMTGVLLSTKGCSVTCHFVRMSFPQQ